MSSFTKCLKKVGLSRHESAIMRALSRDEKGSAQEKAAAAVRKRLKELRAEASSIHEQVARAQEVGTGERTNPVQASSAQDVEQAAQRAAKNPTPAQIEAGVNRKGHFQFRDEPLSGLGVISIETAKGERRMARDGSWSSPPMPAHYGHLQIAEGADGDKADITIGEDLSSPHAYVIDQVNDDRSFDETKSFVGYTSEAQARASYLASFSDDAAHRIGAITEMPVEQFVRKAQANELSKPVAYEQQEPQLVETPAEKVAEVLDRAAIKGKERLDILGQVKRGEITPEEVASAYPEGSPAEEERLLRSNAHEEESAGDVLLMTGEFVSFDDAVYAARSGIESGNIRPVPAQLHFKLGLAMRDVDRVLAAAAPSLGAEERVATYNKLDRPIEGREADRIRAMGFDVRGQVVSGSPPFIRSQQGVRAQIARAVKDAESDEAHHEDMVWYREAGRAIREYTHGDSELMEKMVRIVAKLSQASGLNTNVTFVIKAAYQIAKGETPSVGRYPNVFREQFGPAMAAKEFDDTLKGVDTKLQSFYRNLHDEAFRENRWPEDVVIDRHAINYIWQEPGKDTVASDAQYRYAQRVIQLAAEAYNEKNGTNIKPRDMQAVLWGIWKRRDAGSMGSTEETAGGGAWNYPQFFERASANVTAEVIPSRRLPIGAALESLSYDDKEAFQKEALDVIFREGQNELAQRAGLVLYKGGEGSGGYEGQRNPNQVTSAIAQKQAMESKAGDRFHRYAYDAVDRYARGWQYIYQQDGVPWFRADPTLNPAELDALREKQSKRKAQGLPVGAAPPNMSLGFYFDFVDDITPKTEDEFFGILRRELGPQAGYTRMDAGRIAVINYRDASGNPFGSSDSDFEAAIQRIGSGLNVGEVIRFGAETRYHEHDFAADPEGRAIADSELASGGPDWAKFLGDRRAAFNSVAKRWAAKAQVTQTAEQPRPAYNPRQAELVYDNLETRPGTTPEQRNLGIAALKGLFGGDRRAGATLLGSALWKDFQARGGSELVGKTAGTPQELALAAQILRDPRFETLRVFFTKGNEIVGHTGWTSRLPGSVSFVTEGRIANNKGVAGQAVAFENRLSQLRAQMKAVEADGWYLMHNHPSGSATPSSADRSLTQGISGQIPGFLGHIVIDHGEFSVIEANGDSTKTVLRQSPAAMQPELPHDILGFQIQSPRALAQATKGLAMKPGYATLVVTSGTGRIQALAEVPTHLLQGGTEFRALRAVTRVTRFKRMSGASGHTFIVANNPEKFGWLMGRGAVDDIIAPGGKSVAESGTILPSMLRMNPKFVARAEQTQRWYRGTADEQSAAWPELSEAWAKYDDTGEFTWRDLLNEVDALLAEDRAPAELERVVKFAREAIREDFEEYSGRSGLTDEAEELLSKAVSKVLATGREATIGQNDQNTLREEGPAYNLPERIAQAREQGYLGLAQKAVNFFDEALNPLHTLPDQKAYLIDRYLAQGVIDKADQIVGGVAKAFSAAGEHTQALYDYFTTAGASADDIPEPLRAKAMEVKAEINRVGDELVEKGLLPDESREQYRDAYLPRLYLKHLLSEQDWKALGTGKKPSTMGYLKHRKDIPEEVRRVILGEVTDPGFLAGMAIAKPMRDLALLDWLSKIAGNQNWIMPGTVVPYTSPLNGQELKVTPYWLQAEAARLRKQAQLLKPEDAEKARDEARAMDDTANEALDGVQNHEDYRQIPNTARYGRLRGLQVRKEIYDDLMGVNDFLPTDPGWFQSVFGYGGVGTKATQVWKAMKVAMNPPAQIRNFVSNAIAMQLFGGVPLRRVPSRLLQAARDMAENGRYTQIAKKYGVSASTFTTQEIYRMKSELLDLEMKTRGMGPLGRVHRIAALMMNKAGDFYQLSETLFKTATIMDAMEGGASEQDAMLLANKALFDYSLVHKSVRYARNAPIGIPFLTYQAKVLPRLIETALLHPQRFLPWVALFYGFPMLVASMLGVDTDDLDKLKKAMPQWLQDKGHALILPFKDDDGRWQVVDLGYFMPWSNWLQVGTNLKEGEVGKAVQSAGLFGGPITDIVNAIKTGKDSFGKDIIAKGDPPQRQLAAIINYMWSMSMPPIVTEHGLVSPTGILDAAYGGKLVQAATGETNKQGEPKATLEQAIMYALGLSTRGLTPEFTRQTNIAQMTREIQDVKRQMVYKLQDHALSEEKRREIAHEYADEILRRAQKIQRYVQDSQIHPNLATQH